MRAKLISVIESLRAPSNEPKVKVAYYSYGPTMTRSEGSNQKLRANNECLTGKFNAMIGTHGNT